MMQKKAASGWARTHPRTIIGISLVFLTIFSGVLLYSALHRTYSVTFLDVGQGDAVLVEAGNGNTLLYDAGPPDGSVLRELGRELPFLRRSIDILVLSHPDMDHIGGALDVLTHFSVGSVVVSGANSDNGVHDAVMEEVGRIGIPVFVASRGMQIGLGDALRCVIYYPDHDTSSMETNSASIVLRCDEDGASVLLSGDLPVSIERYVALRDGTGLKSDVLKLGHHGSNTSSDSSWLAAVSPSFAVVSAGKDNRYGHPHREVVERLRALDIPLGVTFDNGALRFESRAGELAPE